MQLLETIAHLFHPRRSNNHRPKLLHHESYLALIGLVLGFGLFVHLSGLVNPQFGYILGYASDISVADVVAQTNAERAKAGLEPVQFNQTLSNAATAKANDMFAKQYWSHQAPDGTEPWTFIANAGYRYVAAGENLARDFGVTSDMVAAWMASPTHKANIMNPRYQEIGVAVVNGNLQGIDTTLVVQMFGRPQVVAATVPEQAAATNEQTTSEAVSLATPETVSVVRETEAADEPVPTEVPTLVTVPTDNQAVLSETSITTSQLTKAASMFSPLDLSKAFGLAVLIMIVGTLLYDWTLAESRGTVRLVGKNMAHIIFFSAVCFILILFKGGLVN